MGSTIAIMVGQLLGAGELERAVDEDKKLIAFSVALCVAVGIVMALLAPFIPRIYNTTHNVKALAARLLIVNAVMMPVNAFTNSCYFTLRSGGKTFVTMLFDSVFTWVVCVPYTWAIVNLSGLAIETLYPICYLTDVLKCVIGILVVRTGYWAKNMVAKKEA